jgi:hypothetical protein
MPERYNLKSLRLEARRVGLNVSVVADILSKWGPSVLQLVISGLRNGLSLGFINEILSQLGPLFLQTAVESVMPQEEDEDPPVLRAASVLPEDCADPDDCCEEQPCGKRLKTIHVGEQVESFSDLKQNALLTMLEKLLPTLIESYGPQLLKWFLEVVTSALKDSNQKAKLMAVFLDESGKLNQ